MIDLNDAVRLLQSKREELMAQLEAVDKALAALSGVGDTAPRTFEGSDQEAIERAPRIVAPKMLKPPRTLSEQHKHALNEGRRKARHARDVAAGLARETTDASSAVAPAPSADGGPPRLVKRTKPAE